MSTHAPVPDGLAPVWRSGWGLRMKGGTGGQVGSHPFSQEPDRTPHQVQVGRVWGQGDGQESCTGVHGGEKEGEWRRGARGGSSREAWNIQGIPNTGQLG